MHASYMKLKTDTYFETGQYIAGLFYILRDCTLTRHIITVP
jgi:hypothetical protein